MEHLADELVDLASRAAELLRKHLLEIAQLRNDLIELQARNQELAARCLELEHVLLEQRNCIGMLRRTVEKKKPS